MASAFGNIYYTGFESIQRFSDEKKIYMREVFSLIDGHKANSVLDIGAGDGEVAIPISEHANTYVAIEQDPEYASRLRKAGKKVIESTFPTPVDGSYDLILMSHVISHTAANYTTLVPPAWELVRPGGHLVVVTHRNREDDDWSKLLETAGLGYSQNSTDNLHRLIRNLEERGETIVKPLVTTLTTDSIQQMLDSMAFLASNGESARHKKFVDKADYVRRVLAQHYLIKTRVSFPFTHLLMSTAKPVTTA